MEESLKSKENFEKSLEYLEHLVSFNKFEELSHYGKELRTKAKRMVEILGNKSAYHLDITTLYVNKFAQKYQKDLKNNQDIAIMQCRQTLETVNSYFSSSLDIIQEISQELLALEKKKASVPQVDNKPKPNVVLQQQHPLSDQRNINQSQEKPKVIPQQKPQIDQKKVPIELPKPQVQMNNSNPNLNSQKPNPNPNPNSSSSSQTFLNPFQKLAQSESEQQKQGGGGLSNLIQSLLNSGCSVQKSGLRSVSQVAYSCKTCQLPENRIICQNCAKKCHAGHSLVPKGQVEGYCCCTFESVDCQFQKTCTFQYSGPHFIPQSVFSCKTCKMEPEKGDMVCQYCAKHCHKGHQVEYGGVTSEGFCDCKTKFSFCCLNSK